MIEVKNVVKNYGEIEAVSGVSFSVGKGEILGLLGPNAAGKTTLMRIMTGYLPPTSGSVEMAGFDIQDNPAEVKRRIGYLPEQPPLYGDMTVRAYLRFVAELKGVARAKRSGCIARAMEMAGLEQVAGRLIDNISKGYKQRVGLAQALVNEPEILILDEPTVGLDPRQIIEIRELIKKLGRDHTVVLSSHILSEVSAMCDRVVILNQGEVVAVDTQEALAKRHEGGSRVSVEIEGDATGAQDKLAALVGVRGVSARAEEGEAHYMLDVSPEADVRADVFRLAVKEGWTLLSLNREQLSLEDVFLRLTLDDADENPDAEVDGDD